MAGHFQLSNFELRDSGDNLLILIKGSRKYYIILLQTFREYKFSQSFDDRFNRYDWGTYVYNSSSEKREKIFQLLINFQTAVCIDDSLDQTFALNYHMRPSYEGGGRTKLGELVYGAKYGADRDKAGEIVDYFEEFINVHPNYARTDFLVAVPPSSSNKPFDLPKFWVEELCSRLKFKSASELVYKTRKTQPMKDLDTEETKYSNISGAFAVKQTGGFNGNVVTIIDDIYHSGATLHELGSVLKSAGARVQGLVATKTLRDTR